MLFLVYGLIFGAFAIFGLIADNMPDYVIDELVRLFRFDKEELGGEEDEI